MTELFFNCSAFLSYAIFCLKLKSWAKNANYLSLTSRAEAQLKLSSGFLMATQLSSARPIFFWRYISSAQLSSDIFSKLATLSWAKKIWISPKLSDLSWAECRKKSERFRLLKTHHCIAFANILLASSFFFCADDSRIAHFKIIIDTNLAIRHFLNAFRASQIVLFFKFSKINV